MPSYEVAFNVFTKIVHPRDITHHCWVRMAVEEEEVWILSQQQHNIWVGADNTLKSGYFTRALISKSELGQKPGDDVARFFYTASGQECVKSVLAVCVLAPA